MSAEERRVAAIEAAFAGEEHADFRRECLLGGLSVVRAGELFAQRRAASKLPTRDSFTGEFGPVPEAKSFAAAVEGYMRCGEAPHAAYRLAQINHEDLWELEQHRLAEDHARMRTRRT
jgi:hypothetical protein